MNLDDITEQDAENIRELLDKRFPQVDACMDCRYFDGYGGCNVWRVVASSLRKQYPARCPGFKRKLPLLKRWFGREE